MSQMVLPQTTQGPRPENSVKQAAGGREKNGDSQFDTVSRAEQQRLENRQAEKRQQDRGDRAAGNVENDRNDQASMDKTSGHGPEDRKQAFSGAHSDSKASRTDGGRTDGEGNETPEPAGISSIPDGGPALSGPVEQVPEGEAAALTFAGLQALLVPAEGVETGTLQAATGNRGALTPGNGAMPGVQAFAGLMNGLPGATGNQSGPGSNPGQGAGLAPGLTEALISATAAEASRPQDPSSLQGAIRFQAAAESASQQLVNPNSAKLPAEAAALRGYATSIDVPVSHAEWGDKLVGKLTWLTARNMSVAEIHLTPPDMGPMEVRVQVQQEQANITVHSANPAVRDQLELHSHRLRDMLNEQGLSLEQFDVSDSPQQQAGDEGTDETSGNNGSALAEAGPDDQDLQPQSLDLTWKGEVDIFA